VLIYLTEEHIILYKIWFTVFSLSHTAQMIDFITSAFAASEMFIFVN
jgi:hypothetical protein